MAQGQCLCGTIRYEVDGPFTSMLNCHCSMCRKHHGAPFATFVVAPLGGFRWVAGEDAIARYTTGSGGGRCFCPMCGSVTPAILKEMDLVACPAGNLDGELGIKPQSHWFVGSKAPWYDISDSLPQYEAFPPEFGGRLGEARPVVEPKDGVIQGSCLCGEVAFEIAGAPERLMFCHCSRCRRARSAAHGSNLFFKPAQIRWLRGESLVKYYKDPSARFFSTAFCEKCGSGAPRVNVERQIAYVPAGALDTDPGVKAMRIFVGSKASWVDVTDSLPRFEELPPMPPAAPAR
jgi:hypothetical protein